MKLASDRAAFTIVTANIHQVVYRIEQSRGYAYEGNLWSPGFFQVDLRERQSRRDRRLDGKMGHHQCSRAGELR